jgi:hypothetical protein
VGLGKARCVYAHTHTHTHTQTQTHTNTHTHTHTHTHAHTHTRPRAETMVSNRSIKYSEGQSSLLGKLNTGDKKIAMSLKRYISTIQQEPEPVTSL